jgi:hypothetical protein
MKTPQAQSVIRSIVVLVAFILAANSAWPGPPQITAEQAAAMQPMDPAAIPTFGNFHLLIGPDPGQPMPPLPCPPNDLPDATPIYDLGGGQFLIDDTAVNWAELRAQEAMEPALRDLKVQYGLAMPLEMEEEGGTFQLMEESSYPSNSLWLSISQITNGVAPVTIYGTVPGVTYEILSKETLTNAVWLSEGTVPGAADQDWTPTAVTVGSRTNSLFLWCKSWISSDGSGIPDWWEQLYFGTNAVDPYALCPSNSWTILQAYQNGWNPYSYYTPPTPQGLTLAFNSVSGVVTLSWRPSPGPVTGYTVCRHAYPPGGSVTTYSNLSASAQNFADTVVQTPYSPRAYGPTVYYAYSVQAHYAAGDSSWSDSLWLEPGGVFSADLIVGAQGLPYLSVRDLPTGAVTLRLTRVDVNAEYTYGDSSLDVSWDVPLSSSTNHLYLMPTNSVPPDHYGLSWYRWWVQTVGPSNGLSAATLVADEYGAWSDFAYTNAAWLVPPFLDGRKQMQQNNDFLLRVPSAGVPFSFKTTDFDEFVYPTTYVYSGLYEVRDPDSPWDTSTFSAYKPFEDSCLFRNFEFSQQDVDSNGRITTGLLDEFIDSEFAVQFPLKYQFSYPSTATPIAPVLQSAPWTSFVPFSADLGCCLEGLNIAAAGGKYYMTNTTPNYFGLPYLSAAFAYSQGGTLHFNTLSSGGSISNNGGYVYPQTTAPSLQTTGYYFARPGTDPLPGNSTFSPANTTPSVLLAGFGRNFQLAGYAKQQLLNGYANVFAYLGQYFEHAYSMDASGHTITNEAGFLSPYGTFFPTIPGPAALVTMTNWGANERGTGVVNVIKLQLDVNHDGTMNLSFGGPDNTSQARPFLFWINNDWDISDPVGEPGHDLNGQAKDCDDSFIESQRGLEDFARLWICGMPVLPTNQGYSVTLSMLATTGNPTINLFSSVETNGGTGYLTNASVAAAQLAGPVYTGPRWKIATISPSQSFTFPVGFFTNSGNTYFLFEGAGTGGSGQLLLTITQNATNVIAQTSAWLDLRDIKSMYEQVHIDDVSDDTPNTLTATYKTDVSLANVSGEANQLIVFVHGWRMGQCDYYTFSETMFKRLYWQGYQGRFAAVRWRTLSKDDYRLPFLDLFTYNKSEFRAHQSGVALANYFNWLRGRFPDYTIGVCAHSMGNIVMMQALRAELAASRQDIDNYVLMQAAVPAHCYDTTLADYPPFTGRESTSPTPDTYRGYPGAIDGALRGQMVNFFNTNDYALATGAVGGQSVNWEGNQITFKPDTGYYVTSGTNAWKSDSPSRLLTDPREIMSFAARPRSKAVGAQPGVAGVVQGGQVDLTGNFNFLGDKSEHSAQFNWNIQFLNGFYSRLLAELMQEP